VQVGKTLSGLDEAAKVFARGDEGDARQLAFEVRGVGRAVSRMMKQGIDVMKDVEVGD